MRLQERLGRLVKSAIAELLKPAEDPRQSEGDPLTVAIRRHEALRRQARQSLAVVDAARRHLALPSQRLRKALSYLAAQARQALVAGQEDQARAVLRRRLAVRGELGRLEGQLAQMDEERENLAAAEERLAGQVERFKEKIRAEGRDMTAHRDRVLDHA